MTSPVQWSRAALDDLKQQVAFIAREDPAAALRVADQIRNAGIALGEKVTGRPGRVTGTYEKSITRLPYVISYQLRHLAGRETIVILRVIHTARDWPAGKWPR